jgi:hypothetical protein
MLFATGVVLHLYLRQCHVNERLVSKSIAIDPLLRLSQSELPLAFLDHSDVLDSLGRFK